MRHNLEMLEARLLLAARPIEPSVRPFGREVEPNDSVETATPMLQIGLGMPCRLEGAANSAICPPDVFRGAGRLGGAATTVADIDYFSFPTPADGRVSVQIEGPAVQHGVTFELVAADGTVLARAEAIDRDGDGTPEAASLEYSARDSGDLFVRVSSDSEVPADGLEYHLGASIRVERNVEHEPNDSFETANEITLDWHFPTLTNVPEWLPIRPNEAFGFVRGELGNGANSPDTDFFQFIAPPSVDVDIRVIGAAAQAGHLTVYNGAHEVVAEADADAQDGLSISFESGSEGPYFVQLTDKGTVVCITTPCVTYTLQVRERQQVVDPFAEQEPNNTLDTANPMHATPSPIRILNGENSAGIAADPAGANGIVCIDCAVPFPQPAYVARGDFSAGTDAEPDKDYFSIEAPANRKIDVFIEGAAPAHVQLLDSTGSVLGEAVTSVVQGGRIGHATVEFFTPSEGKFFILVEPSATDAQSDTAGVDSHYSLRVTVRAEPNVEHEPNDSLETANPIELHFGVLRCDFVCPLANTPGVNAATGDAADGSVDPTVASVVRPIDARQTGYIVGRADVSECPAGGSCDTPLVAGDDFFSIEASSDRHYRATLTGPLARLGGVITLFAPDGSQLASDDDNSDGLSVEWDSNEAGTFFVSVRVSDEGLAQTDDVPCEPTAAGVCRDATSYRLDVASGRITNPIQGRDEQEPNDTIDTANELELRVFPTLAPGIELRGGAVNGIAGGPTGDQDAYKFEIRTGEHVSVDLQGFVRDSLPRPLEVWLHDHNLNEFGDAAGTTYRRGAPRFVNSGDATTGRLEYILANHPELRIDRFEVTVYDSTGTAIGTSKSGEAGAVTFDAAADGTYYAVVRAVDSTIEESPGHYRLGVLARSHYQEELVEPGDDPQGNEPGAEESAVVVVEAGKPFVYTDENGDEVQVYLRGKTGEATITFSNSDPEGSDIVSIEIAGVRRGSSLTIQTDGSAEVGSIEIHGMTSAGRRRGNSRASSFGSIEVDGNVGMVMSDMNVRSLNINGSLGDLSARGREIREIHVEIFDSAMADVGSIRVLDVDEDAAESVFNLLLPWTSD